MHIGGFTPFTLTDYPGEIAAIVFTQGCNFSCPFCHNRLLIAKRPDDSKKDKEQKILNFLKMRKGRLGGLVVTGGEPCIQPDLKEFLIKVREIGYRLKLDTNGSRPDVLRTLLQTGLVDFVAMDIKAPWEKCDNLTGMQTDVKALKASVKIILESGIRHLFRTTYVPHLLQEQDIDAIRCSLPRAARYAVQPYVPPA